MPPPEPVLRWAVSGVPLGLDDPPERLKDRAARRLGVPPGEVRSWRVLRRSLDARGDRPPRFVCRVGVELRADLPVAETGGVSRWDARPLPVPLPVPAPLDPPVVVGAGPAGLFAALRLAAHGLRPVVVERGKPLEERVRDVARYWRRGELDPDSNVAFGEGGAGTFSDGKLTYRGKDPLKTWVFETLVACGAPGDILIDARPHLGTDRLRTVLRAVRARLLSGGARFRFGERVERLVLDGGRVRGVEIRAGILDADAVFLAPGHGARDLIRTCAGQGVAAEAKGFALGVRAELPQHAVDRRQYGRWHGHPGLPPAEFSVRARAAGRGVYSFCMCPGGTVVPAGTEPDGVVVNGMSGSRRAGPLANAALVVEVFPADFEGGGLAGHDFQREWERRAARAAGPAGVPAQTVASFLGRPGGGRLPRSSCPWRAVPADLRTCLPGFAAAALAGALPALVRRFPPLAGALLLGVETRTSSPVRLVRGPDLQSSTISLLYPVGEGSGHSGGIVSSAVDGARAADAYAARLSAGGGR